MATSPVFVDIGKWFSPGEKWGDAKRMSPFLIFRLNKLREYIKKPIVIHRGFDLDSLSHGTGEAADFHIVDMHVIDQYLVAERFGFGGLGVYPDWNNPGLHADVRAEPARWGCWNKGDKKIYIKLDKRFLYLCMKT